MERQPLSDRVRDLGADDQLVRQIQKTEQMANAGVSYVVANGRGVKGWPLERWLLLVGIVANTLAYTFGAGGTWHGLSQDVGEMKTQVAGVVKRVDTLAEKVEDIRVDVARNGPRDVVASATPAGAERETAPSYGYRFGRGESIVARTP